MMETMEVMGLDPQDEIEIEGKPKPSAAATASETQKAPPPYSEKGSQPTPGPSVAKRPLPAIAAGPQAPPTGESGITSPESRESRGNGSKKRKGLTPEQKQKLDEMQKEQEAIRKVRVDGLSKILLDKISVWTETDRTASVTEAFKKKMQVLLFISTPNTESMKRKS
jgi:hypothetical protein